MKSAAHGTTLQIPQALIAIVQSKWHRDLTDKMIDRCIATLRAAACPPPAVHVLPGALELPLAARRLIRTTPKLEAVIAFGIILKGETDHYEVVRDECMRGLSTVMLESDIPIINEVLPVHRIAHAQARASDDEFNKGFEAAVSAIELIDWRRKNPLRD